MTQWNSINKCIFFSNKYICKFVFTESRRFAGHSKWQNIKHVKEEKDSERAALFKQLKQKMKVAIAEGGSVKLQENLSLARIVEQCRKSNMPAAMLNAFLEKVASEKERDQSAVVGIVGPGNCIILIKLETDNVIRAKHDINARLKKFSNVKIIEGCSKSLFDHIGIITTDKKFDYNKAMEDAIKVGADDIEEIQDGNMKHYKFKCNAESMFKVKSKLQSLNYTIIAMEEDFIPRFVVKLGADDLPEVKSLEEKLLQLNDVTRIYTNIDFPNASAIQS